MKVLEIVRYYFDFKYVIRENYRMFVLEEYVD